MFKPKNLLLAALALSCATISAQTIYPDRPNITTPKAQFGFNIGDDYHLANYVQLTAYWQKLASESDRMKLVEIGKTSEGRPQWMAIISSPENIAKLERYREQLLYDTYHMGKNSIEKGEEDSWTITPKRIAALEEVAAAEAPARPARAGRNAPPSSCCPSPTASLNSSAAPRNRCQGSNTTS